MRHVPRHDRVAAGNVLAHWYYQRLCQLPRRDQGAGQKRHAPVHVIDLRSLPLRDDLEARDHAQGRNVADCTLAEQDVGWEAVKADEKK